MTTPPGRHAAPTHAVTTCDARAPPPPPRNRRSGFKKRKPLAANHLGLKKRAVVVVSSRRGVGAVMCGLLVFAATRRHGVCGRGWCVCGPTRACSLGRRSGALWGAVVACVGVACVGVACGVGGGSEMNGWCVSGATRESVRGPGGGGPDQFRSGGGGVHVWVPGGVFLDPPERCVWVPGGGGGASWGLHPPACCLRRWRRGGARWRRCWSRVAAWWRSGAARWRNRWRKVAHAHFRVSRCRAAFTRLPSCFRSTL